MGVIIIRYQSLLTTSRLSILIDGVTRICEPLVVYLLWIFYNFFCLVFAMPLCASVNLCLAGKGLTSWLSFVVYNCELVTF